MGTGRGGALSLLLLTASVIAGCAGHAGRTLEARSALDAHNPKKALALYNEELDVDKGSQLPTDDDEDNALLLLDRSMIQQQLQSYQDSSRDLETADKQVEMLDFNRSTSDEIARYMFTDDAGPYKARPFEKLLVNTMNMLNYLARGDLSGAKIEARRFSVMQKYLKESEDKAAAALLGPGSYLAGFIFEQAGDANEAIRYYDEALAAAPYASLQEPVQRLAQRSSYRSPRLTSLLDGKAPADTADSGDVLIMVNYGRVPALRAKRIPIGLALTYASMSIGPEQSQAAQRLAGQGLVTWVNFPELERAARSYPSPYIEVDGQVAAADTIVNLDALVQAAYEKARGPIIASAIVRLITRGAIGAAAGTGAGRGSSSGVLGMVVALGAQAALTAADTPDTRCWATLPARIAIVRMRLPAGKHRVRLGALGVNRTQDIEVRAGGFSVVNLTELSQ